MKKLDPYISELLYEHNCVIVTDLGGFVANYQPCSHNTKLNMATPPSKRIAFNSALRNNDGLLANHISEKEAMNYAEACEVISNYVKDVQGKLSKGDRIDVEKVGMLFLNKDRQIEFSPDNSSTFLRSSFGLAPVHSPAIRKAEATPATLKAVGGSSKTGKVKEKKGNSRKWKIIEVIPAAAILATLIITPPVLDKFNTDLGTLLPFSRINEFYYENLKGAPDDHSARKVVLPEPAFRNNFNIVPEDKSAVESLSEVQNGSSPAEVKYDNDPEDEVADQPLNGIAGHTKQMQESADPSTEIRSEKSMTSPVLEEYVKSYHIIGGCFRVEENANRFVEQMNSQGADARIIGRNSNGLYMVSLFHSGSIATIHDTLPEFRTRFIKGAWVTRR